MSYMDKYHRRAIEEYRNKQKPPEGFYMDDNGQLRSIAAAIEGQRLSLLHQSRAIVNAVVREINTRIAGARQDRSDRLAIAAHQDKARAAGWHHDRQYGDMDRS